MDVHEELDALLAIPECHAILINALGDYVGVLEGHVETFITEPEAAYFERCARHAEVLRDVFYRWP
ncbi:MAG: hypothetical protein GX868_00215 [Actinobacteria bacterium]|nr:hypothetical protein [Actinomycetota bacterium]